MRYFFSWLSRSHLDKRIALACTDYQFFSRFRQVHMLDDYVLQLWVVFSVAKCEGEEARRRLRGHQEGDRSHDVAALSEVLPAVGRQGVCVDWPSPTICCRGILKFNRFLCLYLTNLHHNLRIPLNLKKPKIITIWIYDVISRKLFSRGDCGFEHRDLVWPQVEDLQSRIVLLI